MVHTYPGKEDFHLFEDVLTFVYNPQELSLKPNETIDTDNCKACFVLLQHGKPIARAAVYHNAAISYQDKLTMMIGHYECADDGEASAQLLQYVVAYARELHAHWLIGPMNGSTWNQYRFSADAHRPTFFQEPYHPACYLSQWERNGFGVIAKYYSSYTDCLSIPADRVSQWQQHFSEQHLTIRSIDINRYQQEMEHIYPFLVSAFRSNFLYAGISKEKFIARYLPLQQYLNPELILIAEDETGSVVGVYFCIDDFNDSNRKSLIIKTVARKEGEQYRGLGQVMSKIIYDRALALGYSRIIHAFMIENATSAKSAERFLGIPFRHYYLYGMSLHPLA